MRIVIDMQGAQSPTNRERGIGRYTISLVKSLILNRKKHEILLVLNGLFADTIEPMRAIFDGLLPQMKIHVWDSLPRVSEIVHDSSNRRFIAECLREEFLASLNPDIVLLTSLFEGFHDDTVTSVQRYIKLPTVVVLYDLIPLIYPEVYLCNKKLKVWYLGKINHIKRADLLLSISASSGEEAIHLLEFDRSYVKNISTACEEHFKPLKLTDKIFYELNEKYNIFRPFIMYTGGIDHRKNLDGLIKAYAGLNEDIRNDHQLVIVCSIKSKERKLLEQLAKESGLNSNELIITGFVPEHDLIILYNTSKLFIFPSLHEGFGLPVLEAMQCGKAVIASNTSSIPEVIGRKDALFNPNDPTSIIEKLTHALLNDEFRRSLEIHSQEQAKKFSWDLSAKRAFDAIEQFWDNFKEDSKSNQLHAERPKLAYISPLPPERSGISDYSIDLLQELIKWYKIDVVVDQVDVSDTWVKANCKIRTISWFKEHHKSFERVLYHFGNSPFHLHMFDLLETIPGVVVLHDFYLSGIQRFRERKGHVPHAWTRSLEISHGIGAVYKRFTISTSDVISEFPCNLPIIQSALGLIVHSDYQIVLARHWYGENAEKKFNKIPLLKSPAIGIDRTLARQILGFEQDSFIICSFGLLGPMKLNHMLLKAWLNSQLPLEANTYLIFVGQNYPGHYGNDLMQTIDESGLQDRIQITGWINSDTYHQYLAVADVCVQLRTMTRGETSAAALDSMKYGLATVVNAHGSMEELDANSVWKIPDEFTEAELIAAIETLKNNIEYRQALGSRAQEYVNSRHSPVRCAEEYFHTIEKFYAQNAKGLYGLIQSLSDGDVLEKIDCRRLAAVLAQNHPPFPRKQQLLVDISHLTEIKETQRGCIDRIAGSILKEMILNPPAGWQIEPVYATANKPGYRYAHKFICKFLDIDNSWAEDELAEAWQGDVFLGLDFNLTGIQYQNEILQNWRNHDVSIWFILYELFHSRETDVLYDELQAKYFKLFEVISQFDGAVCVGKASQEIFNKWLNKYRNVGARSFTVNLFHLGIIEDFSSSKDFAFEPEKTILKIRERSSFIIVGIKENLKYFEQILASFEELWNQNIDVNLVLINDQNVVLRNFERKIFRNKQFGHRIFYFKNMSEDYLDCIFSNCECLLAPGQGEDFGLPLMIAAKYKLPILARDIPIYHEIAGDNAFYFYCTEPLYIAKAVNDWLKVFKTGDYPNSEKISWLTVEDSTKQLLATIITPVANSFLETNF